MRFGRGSKVEVIYKKETPISWRVAEILSGNGQSYAVRYDYYPGIRSDEMVERVSRNSIRPCPPPVQGRESWVVGDVVEVFDDVSWKVATVLKVLREDNYLVRILGCSREFSLHRSKTRVRQSWQDDHWVLMGKGSGGCGVARTDRLSNSGSYQKTSFQLLQSDMRLENQAWKGFSCVQKHAGLQESHRLSSRSLKRMSPYCSTLIESQTGNIKKIRAIEKDGGIQKVVPQQCTEKVDAVAYPREILGDKYMHASFENRPHGYNELERPKLDGVLGSSSTSTKPDYADSDECSVGSCSVASDSPNIFSRHFVKVPHQVTTALVSDAESSYGSGHEEESCPIPLEEDMATIIHRFELHAYRCTLEALYASGPLSWEQEALLTNLRISLHISNDEHSLELKHLIPSKTGCCIR